MSQQQLQLEKMHAVLLNIYVTIYKRESGKQAACMYVYPSSLFFHPFLCVLLSVLLVVRKKNSVVTALQLTRYR